MSTGTKQLTDDYKQLKQIVAGYPAITITHALGQSPDHYEIEYNLKGFVRNPDGSITTDDHHKIEIKLPFGYPHFPPTVKPLTHIFHPDIDPAAVRTANHWQNNPDLSELVITIGKMICGDIYDIKEPFNQEAADWYQQNKEQLPLDELSIAVIDSQKENQDENGEDEEDFFSLDLDDDFVGESADDSYDEQIDLLKLQIKSKNIFAASRIMGEIPQSIQFAGREDIARSIGKSLQQGDRLFKQAETLENQKRYNDAAAIITKLTDLVEDTPGLDNFRNRINSSISLRTDFELEQPGEKEEKPSHNDTQLPTEAGKINKKGKKKKLTFPVKSISATLAFIIIFGIGAIFYIQDKTILSKSVKDIEKINQLVKTRQFFDARAEAETTLRALTGIKLLKADGDDITVNLNEILESEKFIQGLQGRVFHNDEFVSLATADKLKTLAEITANASLMIKQGRITRALSDYQKALAYANKHDLIIQAREIQQVIHNLNFTKTMSKAEKAELAKEWGHAADTYRRALELSKNISDPADRVKISKLLTAATFRHELDQSKQKFTARQWQETITALEQAQKLIEKNPEAVNPQEKEELNKLLLNSKLHQILSNAREAYEIRDWQQANNYYRDSLKFIDTHQRDFDQDINQSAVKIRRTMLMIEISMENKLAALTEQESDHKATLKHYNNILELIKASRFKEDSKLIDIRENVRKRHLNIQKKFAMETRISWLEDNFQKILKRHYPTFAGSNITNPRADFIKDVGIKKIFTLSGSVGRSTRLELQYAYDRQTGRWSLYTGQ